MHPFIRDGDILVIASTDVSKINLGDVIFHRTANDGLAAHRVIKKIFQNEKIIFVTKGDSSSSYGDEIFSKKVLGRVIAIERDGQRKKFDNGLNRLLNIFYAKISPFSKWTYPPIRKVKYYIQTLGKTKAFTEVRHVRGALLSRIQGLNAYRNLARRFIRPKIFYQLESFEDSGKRLLAKKNGIVIGRLTIHNYSKANSLYHGWWISDMLVHWRYRRLGVGRQLVERTCDFVARHGDSEIKLIVFKDNKRALSFYQKMHFYQTSIPGIDEEPRKEPKKIRWQKIIVKKDI